MAVKKKTISPSDTRNIFGFSSDLQNGKSSLACWKTIIKFLGPTNHAMGICFTDENMNMYTWPAEIFWKVTPQTPLNFLGQNLFGDQF